MRLEMPTSRFYLGRDYCEVIEEFGGIPVHIGLIPKREYVSAVLDVLDGILLPGSNTDVDPQYYGEEPLPKLGTIIEEKDQTDRLVLAEIEKRNLPLLAICFGMQSLNVFRGGSLIQDIESQVTNCIKHEQGMPATRNSHSINIEKRSLLAKLDAVRSSSGPIRVNSSHHQAVAKVGKNLKVIAKAKDGVVEAIEDTRRDRFALGVQWHPELTARHDQVSREIFKMFLGRCAADARSK